MVLKGHGERSSQACDGPSALQAVLEIRVPHWLHYYFQTKSLKGVAGYMLYKRLFSVIRSETLLKGHSTLRQGHLFLNDRGRAYWLRSSDARRPDLAWVLFLMAQVTLPTPFGNTSLRCYPVCVSVTVLGVGTPLLPQEPCAIGCRLSLPPARSNPSSAF